MKKIAGITFLVFSILLLLQTQTLAEEKLAVASEKAMILFFKGNVEIKLSGATDWKKADLDMILSKGDSLKTASGSWAEVGFGEAFNNVVRIKEKTTIIKQDNNFALFIITSFLSIHF